MIGGSLGALMLMLLLPVAAKLSLLIQTPGKFSLILFALVVIVIMERRAIAKGLVATLLGVMIATIGIDVMQPIARFNFGTETLVEGINMMPIIIGVFAISEVLYQAQQSGEDVQASAVRAAAAQIRRRDFLPTRAQLREIGIFTYLKSTLLGYAIGVLPGAGGSMAAFVAYADAKRRSKKPEEYGHGSREGIAAAESANNSMCGGAFVPMLMFGIPGDPTTAIVLGVLVINGLQPGTRLVDHQLDLIAPMFASLFVSALILIPLTLFLLGPYFVRIVAIPRGLLYASIAVVSLVGSYVATFSIFQMALALVFGVLGFFLRRQNYSTVSLLLGFILGPDLEQYLRRSLALSDGNPMVFLTSFDSLFFLVLTALFVYFMAVKPPRKAA
jgi:putative tricarboxylic transport membrane protein